MRRPPSASSERSPASRLATVTAVLLLSASAAVAQQEVKPGFNVFTPEQDVEIGRQSALEAERQLPILHDRSSERYLDAVLKRIAARAPGAQYPYQIELVNSSEVNAFSLPGGFLYVNRGLVEAARSEPELAAVLAHEVAHVALRHGTHQASKALAARAGLGILGGLIGGGRRSGGQVLDAIGGIGLNAVFLKFSRDAEYDADRVGARMMRDAGYDPAAMADFFEVLRREQARDPGRLEQFFSSHPAPADRAARIRAEARELGPVEGPRMVGGFEQVQADLRSRPPAAARRLAPRTGTNDRPRGNGAAGTDVEPPSRAFRTFQQRSGLFEIDHPDNWPVHEAPNGYGVVIAPEGGVVAGDDGQSEVVYGVVVNHYDPFETGRFAGGSLDDAFQDLVAQVRRSDPQLRPAGAVRRETVDGAQARSITLAGRSPVTGRDERAFLLARELADDHVLYAVAVAPRDAYDDAAATFERMVRSLRVNDRAAHR